MRGSFVRGYNVSTFEGRGHGSSEAGQNRQLEGWLGRGGGVVPAGGPYR